MTADYDIIILGAGLGGIGMASRLKDAGFDRFVVLEQAAGPGGTWRDNVYPGAACDTESHLYCYSFGLHLGVSRLYARQPELLGYARRLIDDNALAPFFRYDTRVETAAWDDAARVWRIGLAGGETLSCRVFIPAWGQLNRPALPDIPGRDDFAGQSFHSARWPDGIDLAGKRVASVGNAASAVQYIPEIAPVLGHLTVFQRSPNWIVPRGDRPYSAAELAGYSDDPESFRANRSELFDWRETTFMRMREGSDEAAEIEHQALAHLLVQVADPMLRAKLTPDFPLGCKRVLRSDDYLPALGRDNVALVTAPIERIDPTGIVTAGGTHHPVDIIIYGTGFETQSFQGPVEVFGIDGRSLRDVWAEGARAYLGMTVAGFPNLFLIYGPNTNLGHNSVLSMLEAQFGYIVQAMDVAIRQDAPLNVRSTVADAFDDALQSEMNGSSWSGNCTSWYKNAGGRIINNWSGPVEAYRRVVARFDAADYDGLQ